MGKKLIITEKPSVARDFARVFQADKRQNGYIENNEYIITWCVGHLVEMLYPEAYDQNLKKWRLEDLPFLPKDYRYGVIPNVKEQYEIVNTLLHREDVDIVYWAGDSGKEGQTIEENIRNYGGVRDGMKELRVWIDSQTDDEIKRGIREARPMSDYANLGKSGIMRSIEDYALGINFSRALSVKYGRLLNDAAATKSYTAIAVGRVMTCVLGMVVIREREIRNFVETPFYRVTGCFFAEKIQAEWRATERSAYYQSPLLYKENGFKKKESAQNLIDEISPGQAVIRSIEKGTVRKKAPLLFNLTELQAECSKLFKISPDETLQIAQDLYERKLTTYPRTDARVLTTAVAKEIGKNLYPLKEYEKTKKFVANILDKKLFLSLDKTGYVDDSKVTDHYAIIPTGQVKEIASLSDLHARVYELIVRRFLSIFYPPAEYLSVKLTIDIGRESFFSSTKVLEKLGYMEIAGVVKKNENENGEEPDEEQKAKLIEIANKMKSGDKIEAEGFEIKEGKTSPPKRYTSGTIVLAMENAGNLIEDEELRAQIRNTGIGTSATRAEIIKKLIHIGYLNLNTKTQVLSPENLGEMIFEVVSMTSPSLLNPQMTASWEKGLEGITNGTVEVKQYRSKLEEYVRNETLSMIQKDLTQNIASAINPFTGKESKGIATRKKLGIPCPLCKGELTTTAFGYGCSNYWNEEIACKFNVGTIAGVTLSEEQFKTLITEGHTGIIEGFQSKKKRKFNASVKLETDETNGIRVVFDTIESEPEKVEDVKCPNCGGEILIKSFGFGCANYEPSNPNSCKFAIGKIANKDLNVAQVKELLQNGKTKTIRGFKSKKGSKFDACLVLSDDENGKKTIKFDFNEVEAKVIKDIVCPICGGEIVKTSFGYGCKNYKKEDDKSCRFSVGKMAGKELTETQVKELIREKRTSTIYGFKSKNNKKFDARIALNYDETGKLVGCKFDFDDLEERKVADVQCPICGGEITVTPYGYRCINHTNDDKSKCTFTIGKIAGVSLKENVVKQLLTTKKTDTIEGFIAKTGMKFDASLTLSDENKVVFDFPKKPEPIQTQLECPKCKKKLIRTQWNCQCECGFKISHTVAKVALSDEILKELLDNKRTKEKITGFTSKSGSVFDSYLKLEDDRLTFDFNDTNSTPTTEEVILGEKQEA